MHLHALHSHPPWAPRVRIAGSRDANAPAALEHLSGLRFVAVGLALIDHFMPMPVLPFGGRELPVLDFVDFADVSRGWPVQVALSKWPCLDEFPIST